MSTPTTSIRRWLVADAVHHLTRRRVRDLERALHQQGIAILDREDGPLDVRIQYRYAERIYEATFTRAMLDAEAAGLIERWP